MEKEFGDLLVFLYHVNDYYFLLSVYQDPKKKITKIKKKIRFERKEGPLRRAA
jgi:hypothetical protein